MSRKPELLCVGHDSVLNRTRRMILERCFAVKLAQSVPEAISLLSGECFELVLLCYSLTGEECGRLVEFVHKLASGTRLLVMVQARERLFSLGPGDKEFLSGGPAELLQQAATMAGIAADEFKKCAADGPKRKSA